MTYAARQCSPTPNSPLSHIRTGPSSGCPEALGIALEQGRWRRYVERQILRDFKFQCAKKNPNDLKAVCHVVLSKLVKMAYQPDGNLPEILLSVVYEACASQLKHLEDPGRRARDLVTHMVKSGQVRRVRHGRSHYTLALCSWPPLELPWLIKIYQPKTPIEGGIGHQTQQNEELNTQGCVLDSVDEVLDAPAPGDSLKTFQEKQARRLARLSESYHEAMPEPVNQVEETLEAATDWAAAKVTPAWIAHAASDLVTSADDWAFWGASKVTRGDVMQVLPSVRRQVARKKHRGRPSALLNGAALRHHIGARPAWRVAS